MQGCLLENLTWLDARRLIAAGWPVVIPVGAAAKAHGPHLPLGTDRLTVEAVAGRLLIRRRVLIAPTIGHGYYPAFAGFAGSQQLDASTFEALVIATAESFLRHGSRRLLLLNNGVSTEAPLRRAADGIQRQHGVTILVADLPRMGRSLDHLWQASGGHADERETSLVLAIAPRSVHLDKLPAARDEAAGATADARAATAEKGEALLAALEAELLEMVDAAWPADGPAIT